MGSLPLRQQRNKSRSCLSDSLILGAASVKYDGGTAFLRGIKAGAMDLLKQELAKKRKATTAGFGGRSFVRRSELEQKKLQQIRDEHLAKVKAKAKSSSTDSDAGAATDATDPDATAQAAEGNPNPSSSAAGPVSAAASVPPALAAKKTTQEGALLSEERRIDELDLPRNEVIRRLRVLREPVTLFGEDDAARLERFKLVLKSGVIDDLDMTEGQTNDFLRDMIEMRKRQKTGRDTYAKSKGKRVGGGDGGEGGAGGDSADDGGGKGSGDDADGDKDANRMRANFEELCNEDKILVFFKKLLNEWKQELDDMSELEKRTANGKKMVATFKQCARYLSPLLEFCRKKVIILLLLFPIRYC
jgi:pre-mRNA-splicing factor 18